MANEEKSETKKRKRKEVAIFGNYRNYYGYRICRNMKEDPRLMVLKKEWFEGKDCLDIGCNQGLITIEIAKNFCCQSILGIDIDAHNGHSINSASNQSLNVYDESDLVESAYWNLKRISKMESTKSQSSNASASEISEGANGLVKNITVSLNEEAVVKPKNLFDRVSFRKENFVERLGRHSEKYDTILCLSVTKWIHLNWGDDGLITLFANIWRLLRPGGILVLEPQPWKSYQKNYLVSETATLNYQNILIHPCLFQDILLDKIGFRTVENIADSLPGSVTGFDRPIFAFQK